KDLLDDHPTDVENREEATEGALEVLRLLRAKLEACHEVTDTLRDRDELLGCGCRENIPESFLDRCENRHERLERVLDRVDSRIATSEILPLLEKIVARFSCGVDHLA